MPAPGGTAARLVELGAGVGQIHRLVRADGFRWVGLEGDLHCLGSLRRFAGAAVVDLDLLERLPPCEVVLAGDVIEHLARPQRMVHAIFEALTPGGALVLSVPNVANAWIRLQLALGRFEYGDRGILDRTHRTFFTRASLRRLLTEAGFRVVDESTTPVPAQLALPAWPTIGRGLAAVLRLLNAVRPTLFGFQLVAVALKPPSSPPAP
jgi:2-polyprenyl-3-methyl-5-hydroxy-6-metoxy-1,4-benzoquinol methylase